MNKFLKYFFLILFAGLWALGFSSRIAHWLNEKSIIEDDYRFGDLYRLSNLPQFRVPVDVCPKPSSNANLPINLIIIGDSFTEEERIQKEHFGVADYRRIFIGNKEYIKLDSTKKNVLLIETVERHFRERFADELKPIIVGEQPQEIVQKKTFKKWLYSLKVPYNTERHEAILFSNEFFLKIKEAKAWFTWKVLGRVDEQVALSKDEKNIFYGLDIKEGINSDFSEISEEEINKMVENVNATYAHYKSLGFDEVILSIIPNKTTILGQNLGKYNHLIERIQQHPSLKMPFIDTYSPYYNSKEMLYDKGDTHWNCKGKQIWVDLVNQRILRSLK